MAEFKTAEQYVVEQLELKEAELAAVRVVHQQEMSKVRAELAEARQEIASISEVLSFLRDHISTRKCDYSGNYLYVENLYENENSRAFEMLVDLLGISLPEEEDE
jgi:hypothetical protein